MYVGQPEVAALKLKSQFRVINSQAMQDGGVQIVHMDGITCDVVAELVGFSITDTGFDTGSGHPHGEAAWMVIPPVVVLGQAPLAIDGPAEFSAPDDQGVFQ